jgi:hypothetical protein
MSSFGRHVRKLDRYAPALGPHAHLLLDEMRTAATATPPASATVIILAAAVMDVVLREPSGRPAGADGIDIAKARDSREAFWLRERRNGIVHYEGGRGGLMGDDAEVLEKDAIRAIDALADALDLLT